MNQSIEQAEAALASAKAAYLSELQRDSDRGDGSDAQERRREENQQALRDDIAKCERDLETAKENSLANDIATRLTKLHSDLEARGDRGADWSVARALEDRIGAYQPSLGDLDSATQLLTKHGY
jgi:hypothetical protein